LKLTRLTSNSSENSVREGQISPKGNYPVFMDKAGMHLKMIGTDETHDVSLPEFPKA
jgi:hypothetical protein